ncbi:MAG: DUF4097 family beta strand repeat-containing protein [Clostridiaceae bacterium]
MKKVGTITIAVAFIFFGIVLLISKLDPQYGYSIFKFWPSIFILLGGEILYYLNRYGREEKIRFNFLIILVVIMYVIAEGFFMFGDYARKNNFSFSIDNWDIFDNTVTVDKRVEFNKEKNILVFKADNINLDVKKTSENKIILDSKLGLSRSDENKNIEINQKIEGDNQIIDLDIASIKEVEGTLYIPENMSISFDVENGEINGEDDFKTNDFKANGENAGYKLKGFKSVTIENENGFMEITDCNSVIIKTNNGKATLNGKIENIDIKSDNGFVDIDNEVCKNVKISTENGRVELKTQNNNFKLSASTGSGVISVNDDNKVGKNINGTYGNGEGNVDIKTEAGVIRVNF